MKKRISIVIPCFNEEDNVIQAYTALHKVTVTIPAYSFEYIFVDNGSTDATRNLITKLSRRDRAVKGVFLSRNFGPEASSQAGLDYATGDATIIYECDMQDPPELIARFIQKWEEGYEIVAGVRNKTEDNFAMTFFRRTFYKILRAVSDIDIPVNSGHYGLIGKRALATMHSLPEKYRFFRGLRAWVGFKTAYIMYSRRRRRRGKSSYNFFGYLKHAERSFFGFSYLPLDLMIYFGIFLVVLTFSYILVKLFYYTFFGIPLQSTMTILVAIIFFGGLNLLAISIVGKYIQVIVEETKSRPTYIVDKVTDK